MKFKKDKINGGIFKEEKKVGLLTQLNSIILSKGEKFRTDEENLINREEDFIRKENMKKATLDEALVESI